MMTIKKNIPNEKPMVTLYHGIATQNVPQKLAGIIGTMMSKGITSSKGYIDLYVTENECLANLTLHGEPSETDAAIVPISFTIEEFNGMEQQIEDDIPFLQQMTRYLYKGTIEAERIPDYLGDIKRYDVLHIILLFSWLLSH